VSKRARSAADARQGWLFGDPNSPAERPGEGNFDAEWRRLLNAAIAGSGKSREAIAAEMEELLGGDPDYAISAATLNAWTAPSRSGWRFPAIYLPAFVAATGAHWMLDGLAKRCGRQVITGEQAAQMRLGALLAKKEQLRREERELRAQLKTERP